MCKHKVFVYGTLKTNEPNNNWFYLNPKGQFRLLGEAKTDEKYPLVITSRYNIPFLLHSPGIGFNIRGELYEVDDLILANLDILEDHPDLYVREEKVVHLLSSNGDERAQHTAWIYFIKQFKKELLTLTMFECYSDRGSHGLRYSERNTRGDPVTLKDLN